MAQNNNSGSTPEPSSGTGATSISHGGGNAAGGGAPSSGPANGTGEPMVDTAMADVKSARDAVSPKLGTPLTKEQLKRLLKPRRKAWTLVARVIGLTADRSWLVPGGSTSGDLLAKLMLLQALLMLLNEVTGFNTEIRDSVRVLESDLYRTALAICTIAEQSKALDPVVVQTVAEMRKALATGPKVKHKVTKVAVKKITVPLDSPASPTAPAAGTPAGNPPAHGTSGSTSPAPASAPEPVTSNAGSNTPAAPAPGTAPTGK